MRLLGVALVFPVLSCIGVAPPVAASEPTPVRQLGKTVVEWRDDAVHLVVSSRWADSNYKSQPWLRFDVGLSASTGAPITVKREDVALLLPDGTRIPLPGQKRLAEGVPDVRRIVLQARVQRDPINGYFPAATRLRRLGFFTVPGRGIVFDEISVSERELARGALYFPAPKGVWPPGTYTLVFKNKEIDVRLPFELPAGTFPAAKEVGATPAKDVS